MALRRKRKEGDSPAIDSLAGFKGQELKKENRVISKKRNMGLLGNGHRRVSLILLDSRLKGSHKEAKHFSWAQGRRQRKRRNSNKREKRGLRAMPHPHWEWNQIGHQGLGQASHLDNGSWDQAKENAKAAVKTRRK